MAENKKNNPAAKQPANKRSKGPGRPSLKKSDSPKEGKASAPKQAPEVNTKKTNPSKEEVRSYDQFESTHFFPDADKIEFKSHEDRLQASAQIRQEREARVAEGTRSNLEEMNLNHSMKHNFIERGILIGIESYPSGKNKRCAVVMYHDTVKVYIPFSEMYCDPMERGEKDTDVSVARRQLELIKGNLFANISYKITYVARDPETGILFALGSRKQAMLEEQKKNYYTSKHSSRPLLVPGNVYEADIIASGRYGIRVCLGGVDTQIPMRNLSYQYMEFAYDRYTIGDKVRVLLVDVKNKTNGGVGLEIEVNAKMAEKMEFPERVKNLVVADDEMNPSIYIARVVVIKSNTTRTPTIYLWIEHAGVPVTARSVRLGGNTMPLVKGSLVAVQINSINPETCEVNGTIIRVINNDSSTRL